MINCRIFMATRMPMRNDSFGDTTLSSTDGFRIWRYQIIDTAHQRRPRRTLLPLFSLPEP